MFTSNTELNDIRIIICLRKSEVTVKRISVSNFIEKMVEHGIPTEIINKPYVGSIMMHDK